MHKLLYYPNFEIQDQNFLKFALLYIDEIRPIIPDGARDSLSDSMQDILKYTDLLNPYSPGHTDGFLASMAAIKYMEERSTFAKYGKTIKKRNHVIRNYKLYSEKYTYEFENYCLEKKLGEGCNEGILLDEDVALAYMSILAEIISKETEIDMITDIEEYSDPVLRFPNYINKSNMDRLGTIQREIQFYVPVDMRKIPLYEFIKLRSDYKFERLRKNFVTELNAVLDTYDNNISEVDLNNIMECKKEIYGLLKESFFSCAAVAVGVHSFGNMYTADKGSLDFWGNMGNVGISLDALKHHYVEAKEYAERIRRKKQARKYLARLRQLNAEIL